MHKQPITDYSFIEINLQEHYDSQSKKN